NGHVSHAVAIEIPRRDVHRPGSLGIRACDGKTGHRTTGAQDGFALKPYDQQNDKRLEHGACERGRYPAHLRAAKSNFPHLAYLDLRPLAQTEEPLRLLQWHRYLATSVVCRCLR